MQYFGNMSSCRVDVQSLEELMQSLSFDLMWFMQSEKQFRIAEIILHIEYAQKDASDLNSPAHPTRVYQKLNSVSVSFRLESLTQIPTTGILMLVLLFHFKLTIKILLDSLRYVIKSMSPGGWGTLCNSDSRKGMGFFWVIEGSKGNTVDTKDTKKHYQKLIQNPSFQPKL